MGARLPLHILAVSGSQGARLRGGAARQGDILPDAGAAGGGNPGLHGVFTSRRPPMNVLRVSFGR